MNALIGLGVRLGMGALAGHLVASNFMKPKAIGVGARHTGVGASPNFANGYHFAANATTYLKRGDLQNALNNILAAYMAAGYPRQQILPALGTRAASQGWPASIRESISAYFGYYTQQYPQTKTAQRAA